MKNIDDIVPGDMVVNITSHLGSRHIVIAIREVRSGFDGAKLFRVDVLGVNGISHQFLYADSWVEVVQ